MAEAVGSLKGLMRRAHAPIYRSRMRVLVREIQRCVWEGARVLDVGCGSGALGRALMDDPETPAGVRVEGLERVVREGCEIPVTAYDGGRMPFEDGAFDVVILADVLHHEPDPDALLAECARVSSRLVIIKDHQIRGPLAQRRVALIDWLANAPYGVPCLYRYNTPEGWRAFAARHGLRPDMEHSSMDLYPPVVNLFFGRGLQYFVALEKRGEGA
ncbi:MAG: class I SAM-dependent methyltransferase [Phycisphaerales bacterium]|nr:MAG: class I SAM-dependent methyltransferase [Phycisphaerales bacterium]